MGAAGENSEGAAMDGAQGRCGFGRAYGGPRKYIQRAGEIERLPEVQTVRDAIIALDAYTSGLFEGAV